MGNCFSGRYFLGNDSLNLSSRLATATLFSYTQGHHVVLPLVPNVLSKIEQFSFDTFMEEKNFALFESSKANMASVFMSFSNYSNLTATLIPSMSKIFPCESAISWHNYTNLFTTELDSSQLAPNMTKFSLLVATFLLIFKKLGKKVQALYSCQKGTCLPLQQQEMFPGGCQTTSMILLRPPLSKIEQDVGETVPSWKYSSTEYTLPVSNLLISCKILFVNNFGIWHFCIIQKLDQFLVLCYPVSRTA